MQAAHDVQILPIPEPALRPALFAYRRDLTALRYDFPVVLMSGRSDASAVDSLTAMIDAALTRLADNRDADRLRHHAHALERELRRLLAERGGDFRLGAARTVVIGRLGLGSDSEFAASMRALDAALPSDAELLDCDRSFPGRMIGHLWAAAERKRVAEMRAEIDRLTLKVAEILDAAEARSNAGRSPENLRAAIGTVYAPMFDFVAFSRILERTAPPENLPERRRRRLHRLLSVLQSQRFFADPSPAGKTKPHYDFNFTSCAEALRAWRERLPKMIELVKAMMVAQLEIAGEYDESRLDAVLTEFGVRELDPTQAARFPSYLIQLDAAQMTPADVAQMVEAFDAGLPLKVLVQSDDLLAPASLVEGVCSLGLANRRLTGTALALGNVFVLQASAALLFGSREKLFTALAAEGPALISVFSGVDGQSEGITPYLLAAAATESRVFPSFAYDPSAGPDMASRFSLDGNPQPDRDWPQYDLCWQDADYQRAQESVAFTPVDLLACDRRFAGDFAPAPTAADTTAPYVMMVDGESCLHKMVADERLIRIACRCLDLWHGLQELGGVHNSHAERAVARARTAWEEAAQEQELAVAPAATPTQAEATVLVAEPERSTDEPYIETLRCSSCDECTKINPKMFAYDKDKQAYIADPAAGTYRQLVEAAESCQVAIIHPGKPRNPNEPGLEELLARAAAFQ